MRQSKLMWNQFFFLCCLPIHVSVTLLYGYCILWMFIFHKFYNFDFCTYFIDLSCTCLFTCLTEMFASISVRLRSELWPSHCSTMFLFFFSHYVVEFCCCGLHHCFGQTCHADGFTFDLEYFGIKRSTITARCQSPVAAKQTKLISPPAPWMTAGIGVVLIICAVCIMARFPHCSKKSRGLFRQNLDIIVLTC